MRSADFPRISDVPEELRALDGGCGPLCAWQVLTYFGRRVDPADLLERCGYDAQIGVYPVGLAAGLALCGLRVALLTDPDPAIDASEATLYERALAAGVEFFPGMSLNDIDALLGRDGVAIVLYETNETTSSAHLTPVLGVYLGEVIAPNEGDTITLEDLETRRRAPGILRQCVVAWPV